MIDQYYDLTFPRLPYGTHEGKYDLRSLLYIGASGEQSHLVMDLIEQNNFGHPDLRRLPLVLSIHEELTSLIIRGIKPTTVKNKIRILRRFYSWCDENSKKMTIEHISEAFRSWVEHLLHRVRIDKTVLNMTAYHLAKSVDSVLKPILGLTIGLIHTTRLTAPSSKHKALGSSADKQNLSEAFEFGNFLMDISSGLNVQAMTGALPVEINLRTGEVMLEFCGLSDISLEDSCEDIFERINFEERRAPIAPDLVFSRRKSLANLRISAELLIFISQTGMNLSQATKLLTGNFRYQSAGQDALVYRVYKGRRRGEAEFTLFKEYVPVFKLYLEWLENFSDPDDGRLFPLIYTSRIPNGDHLPTFQSIFSRCKKFGVKPLGPQKLRKTRINWLLRKSQSPDLVAEMAQHTKETLIRVYEEPNHQAAVAEISRFYRDTDSATASVGPGVCSSDGKPLSLHTVETSPFPPDCIIPAGCLFCEHQRDLDSQDYVWALISYRYLKMLELDRYAPPVDKKSPHPINHLLERINSKLQYFSESGEERASWLIEAEIRLKEGRYHDNYDGLINLMEMNH